MPALGDEALQLGIQLRSFAFGSAFSGFQQGGDGVVFLDQRAPQDFRGMRSEHQLYPHLRQLLRGHFGWPLHVPGRLPLLGDVGEVQELVEGAGEIGELVVRQFAQAVDEPAPVRIRAASRLFGQGPHHLDAGHELAAAMIRDHMAQQAAEQAHIVPQRLRQPFELAAAQRRLGVGHRRHGSVVHFGLCRRGHAREYSRPHG